MALRRATSRLSRDLNGLLAPRAIVPAALQDAAPIVDDRGPASGLGGVRFGSQDAVKQRMKSVQNIQKITKAMKMVAASKMRSAQTATEKSRGMVKPLVRMLGDMPAAAADKNLTMPISTDKGLCGGINSTVSKYARVLHRMNQADGKDSSVIVIGEKAKLQLARDFPENIQMTFADLGKVKITFSQISQVADDILKTDFDAARIIFNRFVNSISFKPTIATILAPDSLERNLDSGDLDAYEIEGPDRSELLLDLCEFQLAATLYNAVQENNCSEHASRMMAMENSTKNAAEMLGQLTLMYNRTRQASITRELIEIISGASALEG
ncbi:unnamed protein product [Ostreobium quekettii]|uniref:F-ATPase gamma subunit n=1 Tax=Ostreobium quekettii TaxID=121088 RepID=A0A8S1IVW0_9CHLO|nr:unnamed protein product [Ostreobium quekettii]|eukprot:evm.model.scf_776EXC.5 EVM.evm.TU.scf_776EXC.5   scf_776EXC:46024-52856(+)